MKRIVSFVLSMALLFGCVNLPVHAEEITYPMVVHNFTTTEDYASDEWSVAQRGAYLLDGVSCIARNSGNYINISGITTATQTCDKVRLTLYVERSTSYATGYSTYKSFSYSADNVYQLAKEICNIYVERGYYYRVFAVHSVTEGSTTETTDSVTNPISYI